MPIKIKINTAKLDKTAFFKGAKGTYIDLVLWETPDSEYGDDYRCVQDLPRERRDAGEKGAIVGNGKCFGNSPKPSATASRPAGRVATRPPSDGTAELAGKLDEDKIPF